jgi:hypothetical protein
LGSVVASWIAAPGELDRTVPGVVVGAITLVRFAVFGGFLLIAKLAVEEREIVVSRHILGIQPESLLKLLSGLLQVANARFAIVLPALYFRALEERLPSSLITS